jgi:hypothetical protein
MTSDHLDVTKRLGSVQALKLAQKVLRAGNVAFSKHARQEMEHDDVSEPEVVNAIRLGQIYDPADFERGSWRYRVRAESLCVVIAFRTVDELRIVTVWRIPGRRS